MTEKKIKRYPEIIIVKKETEGRLKKLREEINELEGRMKRCERSGSEEKVVNLWEIKKRRLDTTERLLEQLEESTCEVEEALERIAPDLTPLEHIIILKLYVEGLSWNKLMDELQNKREYAQFCYERSTYMRAHRSGLDKIMNNK